MQLLIDELGKNMQEKPFSLTSHHTDKQHRLLKWSLLSLYFISVPLLADPVNQALSIDAREQQRQQERERMLQQQNNPVVDTRIQQPDLTLPDYPQNEQPCFTISTIRLDGESAADFQWALKAVNDAKGQCLGSQGILLVLNKKLIEVSDCYGH
ncbi:hypothetical protein [Proteus mirabilis]|uniref:hypothetical protein n=2 Tax=Morganellaceae TaxID=1903414 RepID=UPI00139761F0|nr:hypothetical protein [Proteus mirabilis]EKW1741457.1 hypothetical protein [Proteus mirabilis]MBI6308828.1 hypothetical protein [Proteus mirabilis]MBS3830309.1 hypothetical protein [Proteus mirabilis]MBU5401038.1 hypothetical protein [Proteus mirabilis]MCE5371153.1 hypothetical protein [Proteus mirabilis]